jgi:hypothetical protein
MHFRTDGDFSANNNDTSGILLKKSEFVIASRDACDEAIS